MVFLVPREAFSETPHSRPTSFRWWRPGKGLWNRIGVVEKMAERRAKRRSALTIRPDRAVYLVLLIILVSVTVFGRGLGVRHTHSSISGGGPLGVVPGEFERQEAVLLSWPLLLRPTGESGPGQRYEFDRISCDIVRALRQDVRVIVLANKEFARNRITRVLGEANIPEDSIEFLSVPANYEWIRDYGPLCLRLPGGSLALVDADSKGRQRVDKRSRIR